MLESDDLCGEPLSLEGDEGVLVFFVGLRTGIEVVLSVRRWPFDGEFWALLGWEVVLPVIQACPLEGRPNANDRSDMIEESASKPTSLARANMLLFLTREAFCSLSIEDRRTWLGWLWSGTFSDPRDLNGDAGSRFFQKDRGDLFSGEASNGEESPL